MQGKLSKLLNSQPTQFEKDRDPNNQPGFLESLGGALKNFIPSAPNPYPGMDMDAKSQMSAQAGQEAAANRQHRVEQGRSAGYRAIAPIGEAVGTDVRGMEDAADVGNSSAILGKAAAPVAVAGAPLAAEGIGAGLGATKGFLGKSIVDSTGRPTPGYRLILGNERAQALGEFMNPEIADARVAAKAKMDALAQGRTAPGPWRPGIKPQPELGSPENPGMFSKIPTTMPKVEPELGSSENPGFHSKIPTRMPQPQVTPLSESPNFNINKQNALTGQSVPISESPNRGLKPAPKPGPPSPFPNATPTDKPIGNAEIPPAGSYNPPRLAAAPPTPAPKPLFGNATATNQVVGNAEVPSFRGPSAPPRSVEYVNKYGSPSRPTEGLIVRHDSPPPPRRVTYQSAAQPDLLKKVMSGDRDAIAEWDRRSLPRPPGVGFMVEPSAPNIPWGKPR
jgi:hypothetical protein